MSNVKYYFEPDGSFTIEDYNHAKLFSSFLPGIAGKKGIPIWAFYSNRGQCMAGFGIRNKDGAIQEFVPLDKGPWYSSWRGFRTFIKIKKPDGQILYEPFRIDGDQHWKIRAKLTISAADITISEINEDLNIEVRVTYFTLPEEKLGGLYRKTEIINHGTQAMDMEIVDGLAVVLPAGVNNYIVKNMGALIRAWMKMSFSAGIPLYRLNYLSEDVPELHTVDFANFYYGYTVRNRMVEPLRTIYDPAQIFGMGTDYQPVSFAKADFRYREDQIKENYWPSAFSYAEIQLGTGGHFDLYGLFGQVPDEKLLADFLPKVDDRYFETRFVLNRDLIKGIENYAFTSSGKPEFDRYMGYSFLDNIIRGGVPVTLSRENAPSPKVFWLYSRKHGDPEREYNDFELSPSFFSQGNGNFRDVNQNRRNDIWFNANLRDTALRFFWNLIQLDGYNPLVVKGLSYYYQESGKTEAILPEQISDLARERLLKLLQSPFTPGELFVMLEEELQLPTETVENIFCLLVENALEVESAVHGEGYWVDHWVYNLDLFESFLSIYPDKIVEACIARRDYSFYDNAVVLAPFHERYQLIDGAAHPKNCVRKDAAKKDILSGRKLNPNLVRTGANGERVYRTNLLGKMLALALNKLASFDPFVTGIEMDASKPGWCDAMNGLPGIFGSSVPEVFSLQRLLKQMAQTLDAGGKSQKHAFPVETFEFMNRLAESLRQLPDTQSELYRFWLATHTIRDEYLQKVRLGLDGKEVECEVSVLLDFITKGQALIVQALTRAYHPKNELYTTYFYYKASRYRILEEKMIESEGKKEFVTFVLPEEFEQYRVPEFLESQVYALRSITDPRLADKFYKAVRGSDLFDRKLSMYKSSVDLTEASYELGRIRIFPRGWLENESIFVHMEYKYMLEVLRSGLTKEFFQELPNVMICFTNPETYGRNPLENSTFIASSAYPQPEWHGNGFVARLSGSNAELVNIWLLMSFGLRPFGLNQSGELTLQFAPVLSEEFFTREAKEVEVLWANGAKKSYAFPAASFTAKFLGKTLVVYNNPERKPTFGPQAAKIVTMALSGWDGQSWVVQGQEITGELAEKVRLGLVERIDVLLG